MRLVALLFVLAAAEVPWTTASDDGHTRIVYRDIVSLNAREVRAETHLADPPEKVWALLVDFEHMAEFMPYLDVARRLGPCDGGVYVYERLSPPIIESRDYTVCVKLTADEKARHFTRSWTLANEHGPAPDGHAVRVPVNEGSYELWADDHGGTRLVYTVLTNPGGSIPAWIARRAATSSIPDLFDALRHRLKDPKWKR